MTLCRHRIRRLRLAILSIEQLQQQVDSRMLDRITLIVQILTTIKE